MPEEPDEKKAQPLEVGRYLDVVRRRHLLFLILLLAGWAVVWASSWILPARYKSGTLILVEQPTMPKNYVLPNVSDNLQDRMQSITQQILSRTRLLMIVDKLHLYQHAKPQLTPDAQVDRMRKDIDIELVRDPQNAAITAFRIFYSAPDPQTAQRVTSELTNLFIEENLKVREQESESTTAFIQSQLASARASLSEQDAKVHAFQAAHEGELPSQETTNLQILSGLQQQLQNEQDALSAAKQQSAYHQSLMERYRATRTAPQSTSNAVGTPDGLQTIDEKLDKLQTKLQELRTRYTEQYPEVQALKAQISETERSREQLVSSLTKNNAGKTEGAGQRSIEDPGANAPLLQLQSQQSADLMEIANRERAINSLKSRINEYQARLSGQPAVAQQLADLTRGYEQSQQNYNDLLKKESDSQMATSMEQMQEGERFTMLDPPSLPLRADFPNRLKMCEAGLGAGLGLGGLVVVLLEFFDDRLHNDKEIQELLPVAVIAEIPEIMTPGDERNRKWKMAAGWALGVLVSGVIAAGSAYSYIHS